jgi:ribosome-associated protein
MEQWEDEQERAPSKSAKKRAAKEIEDLAKELAEVSDAAFGRLPLTTELREEVRLARATKAHGARKRQIQHLAAVLRKDEEAAETLRAHLDGLNQVHYRDQQVFHALEELRDRLCAPDSCPAALEEVRRSLPTADAGALARLAKAVHSSNDRRAAREIFRLLRSARQSLPQ